MNIGFGFFMLLIIGIATLYFVLLMKTEVLDNLVGRIRIFKNKQNVIFIGATFLYFIVSIFTSIFSVTHGDVGVYNAWGNYILENGIDGFYSNNEMAMPPMFLLLCAILTGLSNAIGTHYGIVYRFVFSILFILSAYLFNYKLKKTLKFSDNNALIASVLYLFCPSLLYNSSIWAQTELFTCAITFMIIFSLIENKYLYAYIWVAVGIAFKTQIIFVLPCLIVWVIYSMIKQRLYWKLAVYSVGLILVCWLIYLPAGFSQIMSGDILFILDIFNGLAVNKSWFSSYALNIWAALGLTFVQASSFWRYFSYALVIILSALLSVLLIKSTYRHKLILIGSLQILVVNMFCIAMLERYLMPSIPLMIALVFVEKDFKLRLSASVITTLHLIAMTLAWAGTFVFVNIEYVIGIQYVFAVINVVFSGIFTVRAVKLSIRKTNNNEYSELRQNQVDSSISSESLNIIE